MYTAYYRLKEEPFRLTPDPRFLHLAEPYRLALMTLVETVLRRRGIALATGPIGTGKTTLLHATLKLLANPALSKTPVATALVLNPTLTTGELLEAILDEFEISCESTSKPRRIAALHQMLLQRQACGGTAVLIVDEAHLMTVELLEELRLLNNIDAYNGKLMQVILCGQPELLTLMSRPELRALRQRIAGSCQLRHLSMAETRAYVAERLHAAGLRESSPFSAPALEEIYQYSHGTPRVINLLCDRCLSIGMSLQHRHIGPEIAEEAAAVLGYAELSGSESNAAGKRVPNQGRHPDASLDSVIPTRNQISMGPGSKP